MNKFYTIRHNWDLIVDELQKRTGKKYTPDYIRGVIKGHRKNKTLTPHLAELELMEEK